MKKRAIATLMVLLVSLAFMNPACAADKQQAGEAVILKGMVDDNNQFVDEQGQTYKMAVNEQAAKIMAQPGQKVEVKGTVMEKEGIKTIVVDKFIALPE